MRRARATMPRLAPRRRATCAARVLSHVDRPRCIITGAAWHSARRRFTSQALVRPPETSRSPDWLREGVEPTHGPTLSDEGNREGSSTAERKVGATTAPGPAARQGSARQCPESGQTSAGGGRGHPEPVVLRVAPTPPGSGAGLPAPEASALSRPPAPDCRAPVRGCDVRACPERCRRP